MAKIALDHYNNPSQSMISAMAEYQKVIMIPRASVNDALRWLDDRAVDFEWVTMGAFYFKSLDDAMLFKLTFA